MNSQSKQYLFYASLIIIASGFALVLIGTFRAKNTGFETKTLWDWMELLIIPFVLAVGAFYLNRSERALERQISESRSKLERDLATDRQQEVVLQSYLDRMAELLLNEKLRASRNKEVHNVARTRTLTVLRVLDGTRKGIVLRFLYEAGLIGKKNPIVDLRDADLSYANLISADLSQVKLSGTNLSYAQLKWCNLEGADLNSANLEKADLNGAYLRDIDLSGANLYDVNLYVADLRGADLRGANLVDADLRESDLSIARLNSSFLFKAVLHKANLKNATLNGARLNFADLSNADLNDASLSDADLKDAVVSQEQLYIANTLKGAIMPDGTIHD